VEEEKHGGNHWPVKKEVLVELVVFVCLSVSEMQWLIELNL